MGMFTISLFLGFGIGPLFGGLIMDLFSVNTAFMAMGVLCMTACFLVVLLLPASSSRHLPDTVSPSSYRKILSSKVIKGVVLYRFASAFTRASILSFLPLYASYKVDMSSAQIGMVISTSVLLTSFFQYPFGKLADRMNRRNLILLGSIPYSLAVVLFPFTTSFSQVLCINLILGVFGALPMPATSAIIVGEGKKFGMGSTMAVFNVSMSLGLGCGPLVSGLIHDLTGLAVVFYFASFVGVSGTILAGYFLREPLPEIPAEEIKVIEEI
jgi:MFS family permease